MRAWADQPSPLTAGLVHAARQLLHRRFVIVNGQDDLFEVVLAAHPPSRFSSRLNGRHQQPDQNPDDRDDHQQFHQGKAGSNRPVSARRMIKNPFKIPVLLLRISRKKTFLTRISELTTTSVA